MTLAGLKRATLVTMCLSVAGSLAAQTPPSSEGTPAPQPVTIHTTEALPQVAAPFARLFQNLGDDLRGLSSPEHALWFGAAGSAGFVGHILDEEDLTARAASSQSLETFFDAGKVLGGSMVQIGGALATYAVGRIADNRAVADLGNDLIRAQILNGVVTQGIKLTARRGRPDGGNFSFPSGHSSATFATATVLQRHLGWKAGVPAYALATYVAASRLQENRHYLSDVIFGATIGLLAGRTVTVGRGSSRFKVAPLATNGGVGVALVKVAG